jgi:hypothetical protein
MHPSLDHACEVYHESDRIGTEVRAAGERRGGPARKGNLKSVSLLLGRGASCLSVLAEIAIDRAVSAGTETVMVEAA